MSTNRLGPAAAERGAGLVDRGATKVMDERGQPQAPQREAVVRHATGQLERAVEALDEVGAEDPPLEPRVVRPLGDVPIQISGSCATRGVRTARSSGVSWIR